MVSLPLLSRAQIGEEILDHRGITQEDIAQMDAKIDDEVAGGDPSKQVRKDWAKTTEQTDEDKKLMEEWEQHMHDFVPEDITTVVVEPRREVVSYKRRLCNLYSTYYEHTLHDFYIDLLRRYKGRDPLVHQGCLLRGPEQHN